MGFIEKKGGRLASLEVLRFLAAAVVVFAHFEQMTGAQPEYFALGCVYVEFFFMLTGFYMAGSAMKSEAPIASLESVRYSYKKAKAIYLVYFLALIFTFFINIFISSPVSGAAEAFERLFHFKWEFVYLQMLGFNQAPQFNLDYLLGPGWYLSAMFIALVPAYFLARRFKGTFCGVIAPICACSIYFYIIQNYGTLDVGNEILPFAMLGVLRALAGLFMGAFAFAVFKRVSKAERTKSFKLKASAVEYICYILLLLLPLFSTMTGYSADMTAYLPVLAALIIIGNLCVSRVDCFLNSRLKRLSLWLGNLSLYVFLFHWGILFALKDFFTPNSFGSYAAFFCIVTAVSAAVMLLVEVVIKGRLLGKKRTA